MPIVRDLNGEIVPVGKTYRKLEEPFLGIKTIPSWMNNTFGSYSISTPKTTQGYLKISTGLNLNDKAEIKLLGGICMDYVKEVMIKMDSFYFSHGDAMMDVCVSLQSKSNAGVSFGQQYSKHIGDNPELMRFIARKKPNVNTARKVNYTLTANGEYKKRKNISFHLRNDRTVYMMENDIVVAEHQFSSEKMDLNDPIEPSITIHTKKAGIAVSLYVSRIELGIWHN